jgi:hypothetical protein
MTQKEIIENKFKLDLDGHMGRANQIVFRNTQGKRLTSN